MIFRTFDGKLMLSLHSPNSGGRERPTFIPVREAGDGLVVADERFQSRKGKAFGTAD